MGKYFFSTGNVIFCALSYHTTKVLQAHVAIIRFDTFQYDSIRFRMILCAVPAPSLPHGMPRWATMNLSCATFCHQIAHHAAHFRSECINSAPLVCIHRIGKSFVTSDWCMPFDDCESKNGKYFVLLPRFGMAGGVGLLMLYFISVRLSYSLM